MDWKAVEEMKTGDKMVVKLGEHPEDIITELKPLASTSLIQPKDIEWFLGVMYAGGSIHDAGLKYHFAKNILRY